MYRQFETFKNMPIKEQYIDITNTATVINWSEEIIEKIENSEKKDTRNYAQILENPNASATDKANAINALQNSINKIQKEEQKEEQK